VKIARNISGVIGDDANLRRMNDACFTSAASYVAIKMLARI